MATLERVLLVDYVKTLDEYSPYPHTNKKVMTDYLKSDSTFRKSHEVALINGKPMFSIQLDEEPEDRVWRSYLEELLLSPYVDATLQESVNAVQLVAEKSDLEVRTLPFHVSDDVHSDDLSSLGFWVEDHATIFSTGEDKICNVKLKSKQRNEVKNAKASFLDAVGGIINNIDLNPYRQEDHTKLRRIIGDQALYWR